MGSQQRVGKRSVLIVFRLWVLQDGDWLNVAGCRTGYVLEVWQGWHGPYSGLAIHENSR